MKPGFVRWLLAPFRNNGARDESSTRADFRVRNSRAAIIFIHGFTGDARATWSSLIDYVLQEPTVSTWDVYGLGFPSSLRIDVPEVWAADPDLNIIARQLATTLSLDPFRKYDALALAAHSMGGLAVQRALLDNPGLTARISNLFLFGTPSGGLPKARLVRRLKRQFRDMSPDSAFIWSLRKDWNEKFGDNPPFPLRAVAGERDEFVPPSTSLKPFPTSVQAAVPGNHIGIVRPTSATHQSVRIVIESLTGGNRPLPPIDSARLAVELGKFRQAVEVLLPRATTLDDNALVSLALALESVGRKEEALEVLQTSSALGLSSTDAMGTLAGRLKRRWLVSRNAIDFQRALELYERGLLGAEASGDCDQAYYHAINVAFLRLMQLPPFGAVSDQCKQMARRALDHCKHCTTSQWRIATEGEALLLLGELDDGVARYTQAIALTSSQRQIDSMYAQALRIAERVYGEDGLIKIEQVFGLHR